MSDSNLLGQMILKHWQTHHPKMLAELQSNHQLEQTLHETQERAGDLLYELISVQKMDYQAAWETVTQEWTFPPSEDRPPQRSFAASIPRKKKHPPATSG
jgi:CRISPR/Cas system-associated endonuclease Cas1